MKEIIEMSEGNPGALTCLMGFLAKDIKIAIAGLTILPKLKDLDITGTDIYVFWSDLCNKDYTLMADLCNKVPDDILKKACSKQDYSGREMIKPYL